MSDSSVQDSADKPVTRNRRCLTLRFILVLLTILYVTHGFLLPHWSFERSRMGLHWDHIHQLTGLGADGYELTQLWSEGGDFDDYEIALIISLQEMEFGDVMRFGTGIDTPCGCAVELMIVAGYTDDVSNVRSGNLYLAEAYAVNTGNGMETEQTVGAISDFVQYEDEWPYAVYAKDGSPWFGAMHYRQNLYASHNPVLGGTYLPYIDEPPGIDLGEITDGDGYVTRDWYQPWPSAIPVWKQQ